jgi:hypothetical protein
MAHVLEDSVALDALEEVVGKGELFDVGHDVHAGGMEQVEIDITGRASAGPAHVEVPAAQRCVARFVRIVNQRRRRLEQASQPAKRTTGRHQRSE